MKNYFVVGISVTLTSGALRLTPEQYSDRSWQLSAGAKKGIYTIVSPVTFKRGEKFGYDGEVNRRLAEEMIEGTPQKPIGDPATVEKKRGIIESLLGGAKKENPPAEASQEAPAKTNEAA